MEQKFSTEVTNENNISIKDESDYLINRNIELENDMNESFLFEIQKKQEKKFKLSSKLPFILFFFIIIVIFTIVLVIRYIYIYNKYIANFIINEIPWVVPELNNRLYKNYIFNNGLEVLLIQDANFDMDGGAILIENGYLDNPLEEGISTFACNLLTHNAFQDTKKIPALKDYFGTYLYETEEYYTNFRFDILNNGYKKFLSIFSQILNVDNIKITPNFTEIIKTEMDSNYYYNSIDYYYKENHLLEYLVYNFKNESGGEILPIGNSITLDKYNDKDLEEKVKKYIKKIIDPKKIKIVLFSKYKFLISEKYMKKYFHYLTTIDSGDSIVVK